MSPEMPAWLTWWGKLQGAPAKYFRHGRLEWQLLGIARLLVLVVPFRWLVRTLGEPMEGSAMELPQAELQLTQLIRQAVCAPADHTPWKSVCLPQAMVGQWMLRRRGPAGTLYQRVAKAEYKPQQLSAHAWLRCGALIPTGVLGHRQFTVVGMFAGPRITSLVQA